MMSSSVKLMECSDCPELVIFLGFPGSCLGSIGVLKTVAYWFDNRSAISLLFLVSLLSLFRRGGQFFIWFWTSSLHKSRSILSLCVLHQLLSLQSIKEAEF